MTNESKPGPVTFEEARECLPLLPKNRRPWDDRLDAFIDQCEAERKEARELLDEMAIASPDWKARRRAFLERTAK